MFRKIALILKHIFLGGGVINWPKKAQSWADIYAFISSINGQNSALAGSAFEIFCKHFFLTNQRFNRDYRNVWLQSEVPSQVRRKLNLPTSDYGYDLVLETIDGKFGIVQCKFTTNQGKLKLHWTGTNLSSWLAVSSKADIRVLFTNASAIDNVSRKKASEKIFYEFSLLHLLGLSTIDVRRILASIRGHVVPPLQRYVPKPHQKEAIEAVIKGFSKDNRGKLILPCAAGKTLTSLWIKERLRARRTLVLVPSLALLRQFKEDWKAQESQRSAYLCVCSEKDIDRVRDNDSAATHLSELGAPVTTNSNEIRRCLKELSSLVVYSTYQSSPRVAAAMRKEKLKFDLVVCDEAHKTAGERTVSSFATVLSDSKIPASKRLFMTATPRIVSEAVKNRLGNHYLKYLADMNDRDTYGPDFYRMSFAAAIKRKILVDYKIVAIGVTRQDVQTAIAQRKWAASGTLDEVANNVALVKAMNDYQCTHAVTFHSTVRGAREFYERHNANASGIAAFHVNGAMSSNERAQIISDFKHDSRAIVTNARCLTEGVDVPSIDCVYFCDPKNSKIDIIQASGRALRLYPAIKKKFGYIVVPIFHTKGSDLEKSVHAGVFKNLVAVIRAMADQDSRLEDEIHQITYGKGPRRNGGRSIIRSLESAKLIDLADFSNELKKSIFTEVIRKTVIPWRRFDRAREFVHQLGLTSQGAWNLYAQGKLRGFPEKPDDIPNHPKDVYTEWSGWGDWHGHVRKIGGWRSFAEARKFVRGLELGSEKNWRLYCKGNLKWRVPKKPPDIPANPAYVYDEFLGIADWLGTKPAKIQWREFQVAKRFVHSLNLKTTDEWFRYCRGQIKKMPKKPADIPTVPRKVYAKQFVSMSDWLGTTGKWDKNKKWRAFVAARAFVRKLELRNTGDWVRYAKGEMHNKGKLPEDIPAYPHTAYRGQYKDIWDWLGTKGRVPRLRGKQATAKPRPFFRARSFVRKLGLRTQTEWIQYRKGLFPHLPKKPPDIPSRPERIYARSWKNTGDWLGTFRMATRKRKYWPYNKAKKYVRRLHLKNQSEWRLFTKGSLDVKKPDEIPSNPQVVYKKSWIGMSDWLGTKKK